MIHKTAIVDERAKISSSASVGPFCVIGCDVELGDGVELVSHVCIEGKVTIGHDTKIYPFASVGFAPQDLKYVGEDSEVVIGSNTTIREHVTIHRGTIGGIMKTVVGNGCLLMAGAHVAHDCVVGNNVIMANQATLGGHVFVDDFAIIGGLAAIHQFVRVGRYSIIGGMSGVAEDVIPYGSVMGKRARLVGLNIIGMKRHKFDRENIGALRRVYKLLFSENNVPCDGYASVNKSFDAKLHEVAEEYEHIDCVKEVVLFLLSESKRSICMPEYDTDSSECSENE